MSTPSAPATPATPATPYTVAGGAGGLTAQYDDITTEATQLTSLSGTLLELTATLQATLADPNVLAGAALDPGGAARYEGAIAFALDGPTGLAATASEIGAHALVVRGSVLAYTATDAALAELVGAAKFAAGDLIGAATPVLAALAVLAAPEIVVALGADLLAGGNPEQQAQQFLLEHPWLTRDLVAMSPGILSGVQSDVSAATLGLEPLLAQLLGLPPVYPTTVPQATGFLAALYNDGAPVVTAGASEQVANPTDVSQLLTEIGKDEGANQQVLIKQVTSADGSRAYIVSLPGTRFDDASPSNVYDMGTNFRSLAGQSTTYQQGVEQAMQQAGIQPGDPILLVGHSQGGMVATQAAADLTAQGYDVTHVVTAGSPVATMDVPSSVQELSFQNANDLVPQLAGTTNPDAPNRTTVDFSEYKGSVVADHSSAETYAPVAAEIDSNTDASIAAWKAGTAQFFGGTSTTQTGYSISRGH